MIRNCQQPGGRKSRCVIVLRVGMNHQRSGLIEVHDHRVVLVDDLAPAALQKNGPVHFPGAGCALDDLLLLQNHTCCCHSGTEHQRRQHHRCDPYSHDVPRCKREVKFAFPRHARHQPLTFSVRRHSSPWRLLQAKKDHLSHRRERAIDLSCCCRNLAGWNLACRRFRLRLKGRLTNDVSPSPPSLYSTRGPVFRPAHVSHSLLQESHAVRPSRASSARPMSGALAVYDLNNPV